MPKRGPKRQKTSANDDASKDDEERRLESLLFGVPYVPAGEETVLEDEDEGEEENEKELQNLTDGDLFFVDDGARPSGDAIRDEEDDNEENERGKESDGEEAEPTQRQAKPEPVLSSRKKSAWTDPSDPPVVSLVASNRTRKLRDAPSETTLSGREYESRLRRQFERIHPAPAWAKKRRREGEDDEDNDDSLFTSTGGILSRQNRHTLSPGVLAIERLRDANQSSQKANVKSIAFHPSERVPVLAVGTSDRRVRLYNVDGHTSPLLQTLHIPTIPFTSQSSVSFHPSGTHLLLTGNRPYYAVYDLQSGALKTHNGLWGTRFSSPGIAKAECMEITAFSPTGGMLAVAGRGGNVHLVDWQSGGGQVVGTLKCGAGGGIRQLWWTKEGEEEGLAMLTGDADVCLWDVGQRRCVRRWRDEGAFRGAGRAIAGTTTGGWMAIGSNTGLVNMYTADAFTGGTSSTVHPKPTKTIGNLTTAISTLRFNHDAQLMAIASREKKDAMKLIHLPSLTAFSNWPTSSSPIGHVTAVDFSPRSDYLVIGNTKGRVLLYHLKDYGKS
ncbi:WD40 repeat-like protein [Guyanagaster necrorhizus]|uniref:WD40 repeat-like protein n=1 Tax=Guyanagaster necrorhizus TaxID=856835 RepID=A0A9P7VFP3_9AGAR|nr:WD40 repeat-like protein [Guyanagaster necrorhizus MCA 3950]KAG7439545.1 WD40 repeat-like protein [Guyanagaster necrorhizus MCA 3950]